MVEKPRESLMMCPICQNPSARDFSPFCSKTCKNKDLLGWLNEKYHIPCDDPVAEKIEQEGNLGEGEN